MKQRVRESNLVPAQIGDRRTVGGIVDRYAHHQTEREGAVDDAMTEFGVLLAVLLIQVQIGGIVGETREPDIVRLGYGAAYRMFKHLAYGQFIEI